MYMKISELVEIAKQYLVLDDGRGEIQLVRRIQAAKGERACFATSDAKACDRGECWCRRDCLRKLLESEADY